MYPPVSRRTVQRAALCLLVLGGLGRAASGQSTGIDTLLARISPGRIVGHIQALESAGGHGSRVAYTPGHDSASSYILRTLTSFPGLTSVEPDTFYVSLADTPYNTHPLRNIVARIEGSVEPQKQIIIGAHFDASASRMGPTTWNAQWNTIAAPGADDNATGVAIVLELARVLSDPSNSVRPAMSVVFVAFGAEESVPPYAGRTTHPGSRYFAHKAWSRGDQVVGMISVDMVGYNPSMDYVSIVSNTSSQSLGASVAGAVIDHGLGLATNNAPYAFETFSDHNEFWQYGFRAICLIEHNPPWNSSAYYTANPYYHTSSDASTTLNMSQVTKVAKATLAAVLAETGLTLTEVAERPASALPDHLVLGQNFPNPFNPATRISFGLPSEGSVRITVHDLLGREVCVLVNGRMAAGEHGVTWDAVGMPGGTYIVRCVSVRNDGSAESSARKMVLAK